MKHCQYNEVRDNIEGELNSLGDESNTRSCPCILIGSISLMSWDSIHLK